MQKIKYGVKEFLVKSIVANDYKGVDTIEITFDESVIFTDVQAFYDTAVNAQILRRMECYEETISYEPASDVATEPIPIKKSTLQGVHIGYTKPIDISCFSGVTKVKIEKELEVESKLAVMQDDLDYLTMAQLATEGIL